VETKATLVTRRPIACLSEQLKNSESFCRPYTFTYSVTREQALGQVFRQLGTIEVKTKYETYQLGIQPKYLYSHCITGYFGCPNCGAYHLLERYKKEDIDGREYASCPSCKADTKIDYEQI
jgi:hypothetical protein